MHGNVVTSYQRVANIMSVCCHHHTNKNNSVKLSSCPINTCAVAISNQSSLESTLGREVEYKYGGNIDPDLCFILRTIHGSMFR